MNVAPYGFSDSVPFESLRSKIDDEILNNKKTDETQSEEIEEQSEKDAQHDEAIANLESSVGEVSEKAEQAQESAEQAAEAAAQAGEDAAAAKGVADEAKAMAEENAAAIEVLNGDGEGSVNKTVSDAINEVVSGAPEAFDTLKEIGEYLEEHGSEVADMMSAITKNTDDIQTNADAIAENASAISANADAIAENVQAIEDVSAAVAEEATAREDADNAIKTEVDEKIAPLAVKAEVTEEINAAVAPLQESVDKLEVKKVDWTESTPGRNHIVLKNHDSILGTATDGSTYNVAMVSKWDVADFGSSSLHLNLNSKDGVATINDDKQIAIVDQVDAVEAKVDAIDLEPYATKEEVNALGEKKVDWVESTPGRKHIVLKNHDSVLGTALDGTTYNLAMVSKWDVADFGSSSLHLNLNSKDGVATINDNKQIAVVDDVNAAKAELEGEVADAVLPYFDGAEYDSNEKKIFFKHGDEVKAEINAADFIKDGMVDSVVVENGKLVISFNTESGKEAIEVNVSDIFNADNYYTKDQVDAIVAPLAVKSAVDEQINGEVAILNAAIAAKVDTTAYDAKVAEIETALAQKAVAADVDAALAQKVDVAAYDAKVAEIEGALAQKAVAADVDAALAQKANAADVYTKDEVDNKFDGILNDLVDSVIVDGDNLVLVGGEF